MSSGNETEINRMQKTGVDFNGVKTLIRIDKEINMRVVERCKTNMVELKGIWAKHGIAMCSMEQTRQY